MPRAVCANSTMYRPRADGAARNPKSGGTHDRSLRDCNVQERRGECGWHSLSLFMCYPRHNRTVWKVPAGLAKSDPRALSVADLPRGGTKRKQDGERKGEQDEAADTAFHLGKTHVARSISVVWSHESCLERKARESNPCTDAATDSRIAPAHRTARIPDTC